MAAPPDPEPVPAGSLVPVPVTVITGFLGAGKTTLLNRWLLEYARGEVAVVVNELGTIGIDGELLAERARRLVEITGGCICCASPEELVEALSELSARQPAPRRIFVETSGAASPAGVLRAISGGAGADAFHLDGIVTVVDATRLGLLSTTELAQEQVGFADVVVLSRTDRLEGAALDEAAGALATRNGTAVLGLAARGELREPEGESLEGLLARRTADFRPAPVASSGLQQLREPAHLPGIGQVSLQLEGDLDEERFGQWVETELAEVGGRLLRIKGILSVAGVPERLILQGVADQVETTLGAPWADGRRWSRLVLVGFGLEAERLRAGFESCASEPGPPEGAT